MWAKPLIEPYWNVNWRFHRHILVAVLAFNRTILECKWDYVGPHLLDTLFL